MFDALDEYLALDTERQGNEQLLLRLTWLMRLLFLIYLFITISGGNADMRVILGNVLGIVVSLVPRWMEAHSPYRFPTVGEFAITLALMIEMTGRTFHLYEGDPFPYDKYSHIAIMGLLSFGAILLLYSFFLQRQVDYDLGFMIAVGILFALGIGGLWEIYEWTADTYFGTSFQHGNRDTMTDLIADAVGGIIGFLLAWWYKRTHTADEVMEEIPIFYDWF